MPTCCEAKGADSKGLLIWCRPIRPGGFNSVWPVSQSRKNTGRLWRVTSLQGEKRTVIIIRVSSKVVRIETIRGNIAPTG